ncbi:non-hydrolyzing UDP-N-acetylglucosamine 2-epimerase [[Limnothrix rosea] IAM M-220]|uniref:non-hydrolyzing UDP-N-acetylglucosamine 2-epimerase n=1 Tax=[Limnothrix rosea] IAM M-220 TaxID=454133 RepID=UPI00095946C4|nr:UDP-N-acetylglucosamine 2-epimerase (non-hydrolyzing) [[Limnothrix rosea] IAM M-220]OKH17564.1 UDP-N-acetylglucosamine 2-epimerase [[Limnothrix rosea] IAM M-220]
MPSVCITLGTRPEAIKLAPVIRQFRQAADFETSVILTGQHREMVDQVMQWFDLTADFDLEIMQPGQTLSDITCRSVDGLQKIYRELSPDIVLVQGDTTTAFAAALAAFYQQIPVGHVEAGLRTDNILNPFPEEANRRLISQISQLHFAPTDQAIANLKKSDILGQPYHTGNTVIDALLTVAASEPTCEIPGLDWSAKRVILSTVHRRENWGEPLDNILQGFLKIVEAFSDVAILLPMHRNPKVREPIQQILGEHPRIFLTEPLDYPQLVGAMQRCDLLLTDSGGLQEEAPSLGKPVLVLRKTTERPEAVTAGTARLIGTDSTDIFEATKALLTDRQQYDQMATATNPFGDGTSSKQILKIVRDFLD